jgi:hypothetical protein
MIRSALAMGFTLSLAACDFMSPPDPAIAYATVGTNGSGCGYDWNGASVGLDGLRRLPREWRRGREAAILFRYDPVPQSCVEEAMTALKQAGFVRVWVISAPKPGPADPPLLPTAR